MISINFAMGGGRGGGGERERERGEKGRDPGGLMIVDYVMSPYFFHDHCNQ